jgi:AAHS family 4-hydroxybenzoate transporter-like MFS transporter
LRSTDERPPADEPRQGEERDLEIKSNLDIQRFLDEQPLSAFQWLIIALCFCIVLLDGFDTAAIGYIAPSLLHEWDLTKPALGPVLSAALFGLAAGALTTGPLADRYGRKRVLAVSVLVFGVACLASSFARSLEELTALRFCTGLGLGAAMPNAVTLVSEYCPGRRRAMITNAMFCGFPLGASLGGFLAAWVIPQWGWRAVLVLGGLAPLVLVVGLVTLLPESARFMVAKGWPAARIDAVLRRICPALPAHGGFALGEALATRSHSGIGIVLSRALRVGTVSLWVAYFMGLVIFYSLVNWMPVLFNDAGLDPRSATLIAAFFPLGGVGAVFSGWLMDRLNANWVVAAGYALTAVAIFCIGRAAGSVGGLVTVVFLAGTIMNTAQTSLPALAAAYYPTEGRATGVAWMLGLGRFGGIAGSFLVAELAARHLGFAQIFSIMALPGLVAAAALAVKQQAAPRAAVPARAGATPTEHAA